MLFSLYNRMWMNPHKEQTPQSALKNPDSKKKYNPASVRLSISSYSLCKCVQVSTSRRKVISVSLYK